MDFLKQCSTNVSAIDGFHNIHVRVYSIITKDHNDSAQPVREPLHSHFYLLQKAALTVRTAGGHATMSTGQQRLWVFGTSELQMSKIQLSLEPLMTSAEAPQSENAQSLSCVWTGELKLSDLLAKAASTSNTAANTTIPHKKSTASSISAIQPPQSNAGTSSHAVPPNSVYKLLVEALMLSISYYMTRNRLFLPLNFRTFAPVTSDYDDTPILAGTKLSFEPNSNLFDVDLDLTAGGTLVISFRRTSQPYLRQMDHSNLTTQSMTSTRLLPLVRVAPSGRVFHFAKQPSSQQQGAQDKNGAQDTATKIEESGYLKGDPWRQQVGVWLGGIGIPLPNLTEDNAWVLIAAPKVNSDTADNASQKNTRTGNLTMEWPARLCFEYNAYSSSKMQSFMVNRYFPTRVMKDPGLLWFQSKEQEGFLDPLDVASKFLTEYELRAREFQSLQAHTTTSLTRGSPGLSLAANGHEALMPATIYPTPPDGLPTGVTPGSTIVEGIASLVPNPQAIFNDDTDQAEPSLMQQSRTNNRHDDEDIVRDENMVPNQVNDADDDLFESNGITEADFNFFDGPHMDMGTPVVGQNLSVAHRKSLDHPHPFTAAGSPGLNEKPHKDIDTHMAESSGSDQATTTKKRLEHQFSESAPKDSIKPQSIPQLPPTPPLNPRVVQQDLNTELPSLSSSARSRSQAVRFHDKAWNRVEFNSNVGFSDSKYTNRGRFEFHSGPTIIGLETSHRLLARNAALSSVTSPSNPKLFGNISQRKPVGPKASLALANGHVVLRTHASDTEEDTDNSSNSGSMSITNLSLKSNPKRRKYSLSQPATARRNSVVPSQPSLDLAPKTKEPEKTASLPIRKAEVLLTHLFHPASSDWSLADFPAPKERLRDNTTSSPPVPVDFIEIAQILVSQTATNSTRSFPAESERVEPLDLSSVYEQDRLIMDTLKWSFPEDSDLVQQTVLSNAEIREDVQEIPSTLSKQQLKPIHHRIKTNETGDSDTASGGAQQIFAIPAPRICVQKTESLWELLPSAFKFWEALGLGPVNGHKSVKAYCVYPQSSGIEVSIRRFLNTMGSAWESCRLGNHAPGPQLDGVDSGLVPVAVQDSVAQQSAMLATKRACERLGSQLAIAASEARHCNVIYLVNPFINEAVMRGLCACFYALVKAYDRSDIAAKNPYNRPVLQIVPMQLIASFEDLVLLDSQTAASLAREVYDRCPCSVTAYEADLPITSAASVILAEPTPRSFHFRPIADPPSDLLHERAFMNVAYCISFDERWITVAWIDDTGKYQHTACYNNGNTMTLELVAQEIWESTISYIRSRKIVWQICIAKVGCLDFAEKAMWQRLAKATPQPKFPINLVVISTNTSPMMSIYTAKEVQQQSPSSISGLQNLAASSQTPITTPQTQAFSPGPTPPATSALAAAISGLDAPGFADVDQSARLSDLVDESWGIILGRRLNVSRSLVEYNPALASGYLVKRTGAGELDQPVVMGVNVMDYLEQSAANVESGQPKPEVEAVRRKKARLFLKKILEMYRGLGLLARMKGMEDERSCTPWHISAVIKAELALRHSM